MKRLFVLLLVVLGALFVMPSIARADEGDGALRHAYKPVTVASSGTMRARVDNFTMSQQKTLVCVEAFKNSNNVKTHLGCLWVDLAPMGSTVNNWAFESDAPTNLLGPGSYSVVYTYQAGDGSWHQIKSIDMQVQNGMYVR